MSEIVSFVMAMLLLLSLAGCGTNNMDNSPPAASTMASGAQGEEEGGSTVLPGVPGRSGMEDEESPAAETGKKQKTYEPSIFIIEASGTWQHEIETGYHVNYECELYLDKIEPHDMHSDTGFYSGVFWLRMAFDTGEYISDIIKGVPGLEIMLDAGAEGICDNLAMYLRDGYTRDPTGNYSIPSGQGGQLEPPHDALADKGSFVVAATQGNLNAYALDTVKGIELDYEHSGAVDIDVSYVIHVGPDPTMEATQRRVKIKITTSDGATGMIDGVWRRLPGYPEDLQKYNDSGKSREILDRHQK